MADVNDRLVVELQANVDKLDADMKKAASQFAKNAALIESASQQMARRVEKELSEINVGAALNKSFGSLKSGILDEGAKKIPLFGAGLEALGPAGLAAAGAAVSLGAGIEAVNKAMEKTESAVEYAAGVATLAKTLGVSTDFIQEFNFAARQNEIDVNAADESLKALNESLGAVNANLPRSKQLLTTFGKIGLTKEDLASFHDAGELLPVVADKIAKIGDAAEKAAIVKKLGIEPLLPLLKSGANGFTGMANEARDLGVVMDAETIKKGEEAKQKLSELNDVMTAKTNIAFAQFADTLIAIKTAFVNAETAGLHFLSSITGTVPASEALVGSQLKYAQLQSAATPIEQRVRAGHARPGDSEMLNALAASLRSVAKEFSSEADRLKPAAAEGASGGNGKLGGGSAATTKKAPADPTADVAEMLDGADKALDEALKSLTQNVQKRAEMEKKAVDDELALQTERLKAEAKKIAGDKALDNPSLSAKQRSLLSQLAQAEADDRLAALAKKAVIDREAELKVIEDRLAYENQIMDYAKSILSDAASMAETSAQRRDLALGALALEQQQAQNALALQNQQAVAAGRITQAQADVAAAWLKQVQQIQTAQTLRNTASPGNAYAADLNKTYGGSLTDQFEKVDVTGINSLGEALDDVLLKTKTSKEAFHEWAMSVAKDLLSIGTKDLIERPIANLLFPGNTANTGGAQAGAAASSASALIGLTSAATSAAVALSAIGAGGGGIPGYGGTGGAAGGGTSAFNFVSLLKFIPGFAGGTDAAPGGPAWVGENGPELVNLGKGATVTNMDALRAARGVNPASVRVTQSTYSPQFNLSGAVMTEDLLRQMNSLAEQHGRAAVAQAVQISRITTRDDLNKRGRQTFGR